MESWDKSVFRYKSWITILWILNVKQTKSCLILIFRYKGGKRTPKKLCLLHLSDNKTSYQYRFIISEKDYSSSYDIKSRSRWGRLEITLSVISVVILVIIVDRD